MNNCQPAKIFNSLVVVHSLSFYQDQAEKNTVIWYPSALGVIIWPAMYFQPDLTYSIKVLSRFRSDQGPANVGLIKHILQYISGTISLR